MTQGLKERRRKRKNDAERDVLQHEIRDVEKCGRIIAICAFYKVDQKIHNYE